MSDNGLGRVPVPAPEQGRFMADRGWSRVLPLPQPSELPKDREVVREQRNFPQESGYFLDVHTERHPKSTTSYQQEPRAIIPTRKRPENQRGNKTPNAGVVLCGTWT